VRGLAITDPSGYVTYRDRRQQQELDGRVHAPVLKILAEGAITELFIGAL
jgi:hypothetical protein